MKLETKIEIAKWVYCILVVSLVMIAVIFMATREPKIPITYIKLM